MKKKNKKIKPSIFIVFALAVVVTVAGFVLRALFKNSDTVKVIRNVEARNTITNLSEDKSIHFSESVKSFSKKTASSGLIELYIDETTNTFCVYETSMNHTWSVLPLLDGAVKVEELPGDASMATLKIAGGSDIYYLNTQDNSVAYGTASYEEIENGVKFTYKIFANEKTAQKKSYSKDDIGFELNVFVTLADGSMTVDCTHKNITGNKNAFIEDIELLNYFGAFNKSEEDDFLFVPDGSGAIIKTSVFDESFEPLSFAVYGNDISASAESAVEAIIPAFGIKHGNNAFVSLIQDGDAVSFINADKATSLSEYNFVYPSFKITPVIYEDNTLYISKQPSTEQVSLCYRFLSGNNATYAGLASACREQLIRNSVLSTKTVEESEYIPFNMTLSGAATDTLSFIDYTAPLTTFEQAQDMLSRMKNKGINNVNIRYTGIFTGGINSADIENSSVLWRLGGESGLQELYEYVSTQKMHLYLDINLLTSKNSFGGKNAVSLSRKNCVYTPASTDAYMGYKVLGRYCRSVSKLENTVISVLNDTSDYGISGLCINDAATTLYSDFSQKGLLRQDSADMIGNAIVPLATDHSIMAVKGNFYMLKNIDTVVNLPLEASSSRSGAYISVPFVQLVLHGIVDYAGDPINLKSNAEEAMLKSIEYGACPHYAWNYEPNDDPDNDVYYYDNSINEAAAFYAQANEALNDLRSARMTDHYEVDDGIFCTEYDTGAMIYINYTDEDYTILGSIVEARSFTRVN